MKKQIITVITLGALAIITLRSLAIPQFVVPRDKVKIYNRKGYDTAKKTVHAFPDAIVPNIKHRTVAEPHLTIGTSTEQGQAAQANMHPLHHVLKSSDASRFITIKVDPFVAANEIDFWGRQMSEHALFIYLGLEDPDLKQEALNIHLSLECLRKKFNQKHKNMKIMNKILSLLKYQRAFQIKVLSKLEDGKWIGWLFPTFVNHVTLELDYFVDKLNGIQYTPDEEVMYWNTINSDHASMTSHLLDPTEKALCSQVKALSEKFLQTPKSEKEMMIKLSLMASKELDAFNKTAKAKGNAVKSIIHPVLLEHIIREGERSIQTLQSLGLHKESMRFAQQLEDQIDDYQQPMNIVMDDEMNDEEFIDEYDDQAAMDVE